MGGQRLEVRGSDSNSNSDSRERETETESEKKRVSKEARKKGSQ